MKLKWLSIPLLVIAGIIVFVGSLLITSKIFEKRSEWDVSQIPVKEFGKFPVGSVLALDGENSEVVEFEELERFKREHPAYTFLVPVDKERAINDQLEKQGGGDHIPRIKIDSFAEGKETITLSIGGDGIYYVKYEATDKEIRPLALNVQGPGFGIVAGFVTTVFWSIIFILVIAVKRIFIIKRTSIPFKAPHNL